jgi:hypothetical protein
VALAPTNCAVLDIAAEVPVLNGDDTSTAAPTVATTPASPSLTTLVPHSLRPSRFPLSSRLGTCGVVVYELYLTGGVRATSASNDAYSPDQQPAGDEATGQPEVRNSKSVSPLT